MFEPQGSVQLTDTPAIHPELRRLVRLDSLRDTEQTMPRRIVVAAVVIASVLVGAVAGWQYSLWILILAALVFGVMYSLGVGVEATSRWSSALYGNDREDADHWSRRGRKQR